MGNSQSGRGGLPREKRLTIERLLAAQAAGEGSWTNSRIAAWVGVDVSTVSRIKRRIRIGSPPAEDSELTVRCGGCGASIPVSEAQCRVCLMRKLYGIHGRPPRSTKTRRAA